MLRVVRDLYPDQLWQQGDRLDLFLWHATTALYNVLSGYRDATDFRRDLRLTLPVRPDVLDRPLRWYDKMYCLLPVLPALRKLVFAVGLKSFKFALGITHRASIWRPSRGTCAPTKTRCPPIFERCPTYKQTHCRSHFPPLSRGATARSQSFAPFSASAARTVPTY